MEFLIPIGLIALVVAYFLLSNWRYYGRMFSEASFREFHSRLSCAIATAQATAADRPNPEDGTAFMTSAGLRVCVTWTPAERGQPYGLHISMSRSRWHMLHSIASAFGSFALAVLCENKAELVPYYTESGIHHMVLRLESPDVSLQDFESSYSRYRSEHRPLYFDYVEIGSEEDAPVQ